MSLTLNPEMAYQIIIWEKIKKSIFLIGVSTNFTIPQYLINIIVGEEGLEPPRH